jgi:hypothetical protein
MIYRTYINYGVVIKHACLASLMVHRTLLYYFWWNFFFSFWNTELLVDKTRGPFYMQYALAATRYLCLDDIMYEVSKLFQAFSSDALIKIQTSSILGLFK